MQKLCRINTQMIPCWVKRCLTPVYPSCLPLHTAASMQRCLRIPSLSEWYCRLKSIKKLHFASKICVSFYENCNLNSSFSTTVPAGMHQPMGKKPSIFNNTCKLYQHSSCRKSQTLSGSVRFAEQAPTNTCAVGSAPQVSDCLYLH